MKSYFLTIILCLLVNIDIDKNNYYSALSSNDLDKINNMIEEIKSEQSTSIHNAYLGALIAKKAIFTTKISSKITLFQEGTDLLENEIVNNPEITEYRFLRLILQEKCPPILNYKKNIEEDHNLINQKYNSLDDQLKKIILNYSNESTILHLSK